ncbi:hypothetical protein [Streptomyces fodineus]|uniref:hypothetical protein n=1 Tax=Streptomyces fodineus TaxID=1904616 RepID=UPI00131E40D3|nr:hypothetical protein [Streptomyces fodineus]
MMLAYYPDAALSAYVKIKAFALRTNCPTTAAMLACYLGLSMAAVERGTAQLRRPAPDEVVEIPESNLAPRQLGADVVLALSQDSAFH